MNAVRTQAALEIDAQRKQMRQPLSDFFASLDAGLKALEKQQKELRNYPFGEKTGINADEPHEQLELLTRPVTTLNLSIRSRKRMTRGNIDTIGDLLEYTEEELLNGRSSQKESILFGKISLQEVIDALNELGLSLRKPANTDDTPAS